MKKSDEQERNIANRLYNLDKKVYETTGSTLGRVFPSSPSFALEKIIDALKINREYFLKNEMTLIANMIGTIRDEEKAAPLKQEYDELEQAHNTTYGEFKTVRDDLHRLWKVKSCVDTAARFNERTEEQMLQNRPQTRHKKEELSR